MEGICIYISLFDTLVIIYFSELSDTRKVLPSLLSADESKLSPNIIASYIQCISKVFGSWAIDLATNWDVDDLPELRATVSSTISGLQKFTSNEDYEVQERVIVLRTYIIMFIY